MIKKFLKSVVLAALAIVFAAFAFLRSVYTSLGALMPKPMYGVLGNNALSLYDPLFYAQEALTILTKALGMANAVYRGYDSTPQQRGSTVNISVPGSFTAQNAPSTAQDLNPSSVAITLSNWKEVKFSLTDKELTYTKEKIITDHIFPAAYALADAIDASVNGLYVDVPWAVNRSATTAPGDLLAARKILFDNAVPVNEPNALYAEVGSQEETDLLANSAFSQWQGAGPTGEATQINGVIGTRYNMGVFANQNTPNHTSGIGGADVAGAAVGAHALGATVLNVNGLTISRTGFAVAGDILTIAGHTQRYVVTATANTDGSGVTAVNIAPGLQAALSGSEVVTFDLGSAATTKVQNLVFHRRFAALAMAPLSTLGDGLGARIETVIDPVTSLALRGRIFYVGDSSALKVAIDVLWGVKTLDRNRAVRLRQP